MAHLAFLGSHCVNGVSALHTELLRKTVFHDLAADHADARSSTRPTASPSGAGCTTPIGPLTDLWSERSASACSTIRAPAASSNNWRATPISSRTISMRARATNRSWPTLLHGTHRRARSASRAVRRAHQARARIQAAIAQHPGGDRALPGDPRRAGRALGAAGEDLRRQGGGELRARQADHQAGQRRRQGRQRRSAGRRPAESRVRAELQRQPGRGRSFRPPTCPSRFPPPAWKPPAPAT